MAENVAFIDTETTALDRDIRQVWEVALIIGDVEHEWRLPVDLSRADPMSLSMNGFHGRYNDWDTPPEERVWKLHEFAMEFARLTRGLHLVGACVNFDEVSLWDLLRDNGECPMWHYHIIDVEALAAGWLAAIRRDAAEVGPTPAAEHWTNKQVAAPPWRSTDLSRAVGVNPDDFDLHSALGDARWAKAVYEAVMG